MTRIYHQFQDPRGNYYIIRDIDPPIDAISYYAYMSDKNITNKLDIAHYTSLDAARADIYKFSQFSQAEGKCFAVARDDTNQLIGTGGYNLNNKNIAELVVDLNPQYWVLGIMEIACKWAYIYCKNQGIKQLLVTVKADNIRMINFLQRFNFHYAAINSQGRLIYNKTIC